MRTPRPIEHLSLSATNRPAEFFVRSVVGRNRMLLDPPYQRGAVWTVDQQRALILSWLMGLPIPAIIINNRDTAGWEARNPQDRQTHFHAYAVIDGQQRIRTAIAWFQDDLLVPAGWFPADEVAETVDTPDGPMVSFERLTEKGQRMIDDYALLPCAEAHVFTVADEARIYLLVNGGGTAQTDADMGRAAQVAASEE